MGKLRRFFAMFFAVMMLFGATPTYAATKTGASVKSEYLKVEKRFFKELDTSFKKSEIGKLSDFLNKIDGTYTGEVDLEVKLPDIKTRLYKIKETGTYNEKYADASVEAYVEGEKVATFNVVADDNYLSMQIPELYEKYVTIDMNDLLGLIKKFDETIESEELESLKAMSYPSEAKEILKLTKAEEKLVKDALNKIYKSLDRELLKSSYFEKGSKQLIDANNEKYNCDVVSYKISLKELIDGLENIWGEFKNNTELVNLLWGKLEAVYNLSVKPGSEYQEFPTKEQFLGAMDTIINELQKEAPNDIYIQSTLYHQSSKLIRRDIDLVALDQEQNLFSIYTCKNSKKEYYAFCIEDGKLEDIVSKNGKDTIHDIVLTTKDFDYNWINDELVREEKEDVSKLTIKVVKIKDGAYNIEFMVDNSEVKVSAEYIRNKATSKTHDITMNFNVSNDTQVIEFNTRVIYGKDIKLKKSNVKNNQIILNEMTKEEMTGLVEENKAEIEEKIKGKFGSAFYYEEIMKTTQGIYDRMRSRADKAEAAQIGKAVRVWLTDFNTDPALKNQLNYNNDISSTRWIKASDLQNIDWYVYISTTNDGCDYYVAITSSDTFGKIVVAASKTGLDLPEISAELEVDESGILYIEP